MMRTAIKTKSYTAASKQPAPQVGLRFGLKKFPHLVITSRWFPFCTSVNGQK